jgi:hypothetical protein
MKWNTWIDIKCFLSRNIEWFISRVLIPPWVGKILRQGTLHNHPVVVRPVEVGLFRSELLTSLNGQIKAQSEWPWLGLSRFFFVFLRTDSFPISFADSRRPRKQTVPWAVFQSFPFRFPSILHLLDRLCKFPTYFSSQETRLARILGIATILPFSPLPSDPLFRAFPLQGHN